MPLFGVKEKIFIDGVTRLKDDPSRGYETLQYLDMPYMGLPLKHYLAVVPKSLSSEAIEIFTERMIRLVREEGIFFPDMNDGNVLVRIVNGHEALFPIDWESAQTRRVHKNPEYYVQETMKRCLKLFEKGGELENG